MYSWGTNDYGQLGDGGTTYSTTPKRIADAEGTLFSDIAAGGWHSVALSAQGEVWTWGRGGWPAGLCAAGNAQRGSGQLLSVLGFVGRPGAALQAGQPPPASHSDRTRHHAALCLPSGLACAPGPRC